MLRKISKWPVTVAALSALVAVSAAQSSSDPAPQNSSATQQDAKTAAGTPAAPKPQPQTTDKPDNTSGTSNDRLFYALPNFLTLRTTQHVPPLTTRQKYAVTVRSSFDPVQVPWYGFLSAISQAENSEQGYGQGWGGYGKRFGAYAADGTIENFMVGAILPSALHQDPRFYQSGEGSFWHRAGYATSRIVVTRTDSGKSQFNYSEILGSAAASAISNYSYHPKEDHTLRNTLSVWESQVGYDAITIVVKEFWPDIQRKFAAKRHKKEPAN